MAVKLEGNIKRFIGLSTDDKPRLEDTSTGSRLLPAGSSFLETDTGHIWRWNGEEWTIPQWDETDAALEVSLSLAAGFTDLKDHLQALAVDREARVVGPNGEPFSAAEPLSTDRLAFLPSVVTGYEKAWEANNTASAFSALVGTIVTPSRSSTRAVWRTRDLARTYRHLVGGVPRDFVLPLSTMVVVPFGGNTNNDIINLKVVGWNRTKSGGWYAEPKCEVQATLSSSVTGIAGSEVIDTEFFADTLTLTTGIATIYQGTADIDPAYFKVGVSGFEYVELLGDLGTGGDVMNALVRWDA